ncbi:stress responsive protein [Rhodovibrio sodomensis]|uniref:Stress responsive protein n=1 Tax=Rhodovibrio sodomensis TaxID=1088 RepID=A0ABS1DK00_9PROT|nr:Dabb family protein [Rhodovibrio sodomensis]MBK1669695.1 stress responsive protein [Rhodovibrio sodomensis]
MIRHIVFFTVPTDRLQAAEAGLKPLEGIAHADVLEVRRNLRSDAHSGEVDLVVYGEFADEAALARYKADPLYAEATETVRPLRQLRVAADIES